MKIKQIYCDLDGVLVDFDKRIEELTGVPTDKISDDGIIWKAVSKQHNFWETLEWMPDGKSLWQVLQIIVGERNELVLKVLTGTPSSKKYEAEVGKITWVRRELQKDGPWVDVFMSMSKSKFLYAHPSHLLIDDREKNINEWRAAGGVAIHHKDAFTTIEALNELIKTGQL